MWVIAKTGDFDTFFARIVATDDQGRYLIPGLADAQYEIWTRGYELDDSEKLGVQPGTSIDLDAVVAA